MLSNIIGVRFLRFSCSEGSIRKHRYERREDISPQQEQMSKSQRREDIAPQQALMSKSQRREDITPQQVQYEQI